MGVVSYELEIPSPIPPSKLFKAIVLDGQKLIPRLMPHAIKSIQVIEGDGGPGTLKLITFPQEIMHVNIISGPGSPIKYMKERSDALDKDKYYYAYSIIEGDALVGRIEKISNEVKFESCPDSGGSVCKSKSSYYTIGDNEIKPEEIKTGKEKGIAVLKAIEAHILANPDDA